MSDEPKNPLLESYLEDLRLARRALTDVFAGIEDKDHAPEGKWTARQIMEHLYRSEVGIAKIFRSAERVCMHHPPRSNEQLVEEQQATQTALLNRSLRVTAPERIVPAGDVQNVEEQLAASRESLLQAVLLCTDTQLRSLSFAHPLRGDTTLYGWLCFVAYHELRHTEQMKELRL